jgi:uncharacterized membrane protein
MTTTIIAGVIFIAGLCAGMFIFLYLAYFKKNADAGKSCTIEGAIVEAPVKTGLTFEWKYITLPLIIFFISVIIAAIFFPQLPNEVAYRFNSEGVAESWMSRMGITATMIGLQLFIIALVILVVRGIVNFGKAIEQTSSNFNPDRFMLLIGNIAALPQLVLAIVMFDIFSFNITEKHVLSIWLIILILAIIGAIILTVFFINALANARRVKK